MPVSVLASSVNLPEPTLLCLLFPTKDCAVLHFVHLCRSSHPFIGVDELPPFLFTSAERMYFLRKQTSATSLPGGLEKFAVFCSFQHTLKCREDVRCSRLVSVHNFEGLIDPHHERLKSKQLVPST